MNIIPQFLNPGDAVALVSPSYHTPYENVEKTAALLRKWGFEPVIGAGSKEVYKGEYAGTPAKRLSEMKKALRDPSIKAIICNRGGYGALHLIDGISDRDILDNPKWLVGFSDISTLHGLFTRAGVVSMHATMSSFLAKGGDAPSSIAMRDMLCGIIPEYTLSPGKDSLPGTAEGTLVGGNLCTITPLLGTRADSMATGGIILFVEEVEESMHNIDRQINILRHAGVLDRCRGIILGEFTSCTGEFTWKSAEKMLVGEYLKKYHIPVLSGFPAGHGQVNMPLLMGAKVRMEVGENTATVSFGVEGRQMKKVSL